MSGAVFWRWTTGEFALTMSKYYVVSSELLPDIIGKVIEAQVLLQTGQAHGVSDAVKRVGISRGTFYKYKDIAFTFNDINTRKATLSMVIMDRRGTLSAILSLIAAENVNVLAINQSIPINSISIVTLTLDISEMESSIDRLCKSIQDLDHVRKVDLVAVE